MATKKTSQGLKNEVKNKKNVKSNMDKKVIPTKQKETQIKKDEEKKVIKKKVVEKKPIENKEVKKAVAVTKKNAVKTTTVKKELTFEDRLNKCMKFKVLKTLNTNIKNYEFGMSVVNELIDMDYKQEMLLVDFVEKFLNYAKELITVYEFDVFHFEDAFYELFSKYDVLMDKAQLELQMVCADLYLKVYYSRGVSDYAYLLREYKQKDVIYYHYVNALKTMNKDFKNEIQKEALVYINQDNEYYNMIKEL